MTIGCIRTHEATCSAEHWKLERNWRKKEAKSFSGLSGSPSSVLFVQTGHCYQPLPRLLPRFFSRAHLHNVLLPLKADKEPIRKAEKPCGQKWNSNGLCYTSLHVGGLLTNSLGESGITAFMVSLSLCFKTQQRCPRPTLPLSQVPIC